MYKGASLRPLESPDLHEEIRRTAGVVNVGIDHATLTPQSLINVVHTHLTSGKIPEGFDENAIDAFWKIPEVRASVEGLLNTKHAVQVVKPSESTIRNLDVLKNVGLIVEGDPKMEKAWYLTQVYAKSGLVMLYRAERGAGKELFPRAVHQLLKNGGPFVAVNCAAITNGIAESELFGHEKGAFTDAKTERPGVFGQVKDGGTILLDEIGDMPLDQQAKLLRVLENRTYSKVGSTVEIKLSPDCKIIAATNRNLEQLIAEGKFRKDLYDRLRGCQIFIPPMRERTGEHRNALIDHFVRKHRPQDVRVHVSDAARSHLLGLEYPGNVRELRDHIERIVLLSLAETSPDASDIEISLDTVRVAEDTSIMTLVERVQKAQRAQKIVRSPDMLVETHFNEALSAMLPADARAPDAVVAFEVKLAAIDKNGQKVADTIRQILFGTAVRRNKRNQSQAAAQLGVTRGCLREVLRDLKESESAAYPFDRDIDYDEENNEEDVVGE